jgi:hypothetical protein
MRETNREMFIQRMASKPYLCTGCVSQIICKVKLKPQVIISMDHLVGHGILQVALISHLICADPYAIVGIKSAGLSLRASPAIYIVT